MLRLILFSIISHIRLRSPRIACVGEIFNEGVMIRIWIGYLLCFVEPQFVGWFADSWENILWLRWRFFTILILDCLWHLYFQIHLHLKQVWAVLLNFKYLLDSFIKDILLLQENLIRVLHFLFLRLRWRTLIKRPCTIKNTVYFSAWVADDR